MYEKVGNILKRALRIALTEPSILHYIFRKSRVDGTTHSEKNPVY